VCIICLGILLLLLLLFLLLSLEKLSFCLLDQEVNRKAVQEPGGTCAFWRSTMWKMWHYWGNLRISLSWKIPTLTWLAYATAKKLPSGISSLLLSNIESSFCQFFWRHILDSVQSEMDWEAYEVFMTAPSPLCPTLWFTRPSWNRTAGIWFCYSIHIQYWFRGKQHVPPDHHQRVLVMRSSEWKPSFHFRIEIQSQEYEIQSRMLAMLAC